jgi:dihydrofolate reductase
MNLILACDKKYGIGMQGSLPSWNLSDDMERFKQLTIGDGNNVIIMGKNTYLSLKKPLPQRVNVVISESLFEENKENLVKNVSVIKYNGFMICKTLKDALSYSQLLIFLDEKKGEIWIIGGAQLYEAVFEYELKCLLFDNDQEYVPIDKVYVTKVNQEFGCDTFLRDKTIRFIETCRWTNTITKYKNNLEYTFYEYLYSK